MLKKSIIYWLVFTSIFLFWWVSQIFSATSEDNLDEPSYVKLRSIDLGTFNEYRYRLTEKYFELKDSFQIDGELDIQTLNEMADIAERGYNYLPDNLTNKNIYSSFVTEIKKWIKSPNNESNYIAIVKALETYIESTKIDSVQGTIEASPKTGNAPLTVTLRAKVTDPTGTKIPDFNYIWWIDNAGKREIIGRKISINYVIKDEGKTTIFLDVVSNHKNESGYTDVLPFSSRTEIDVREKVASMIIKVNGDDLRNRDEIKFNPEESGYGLIFDATSSTPTSGTKFLSTSWNFGNGIKREYDGAPKIERITYRTEGEFTVTLTLKTNELKSVERKFKVLIHKPVASITVPSEEGFIWDKFTFKAKPAATNRDLSYQWEIIDIDNDKVILSKEGSTVTQTFTQKWKYNVKLHVIEPSGDDDLDSKIIYINSRSPVADFTYKAPKAHQPSTIQLDGTRSHDPDYTDDGKLNYSWIIDGEKVNLQDANSNGSIGYYTFDSIGDHSVTLEVTDPDGISHAKTQKVNVKSVLDVDFTAYPRVIQREQFVRFVGESKNAEFFEWDFGDGEKEGGRDDKISHVYKKSGIFDVKLTVRDKEGTSTSYIQKVYVGDSLSPVALMNITKWTNEAPLYDVNACNGNGAYIVDRVETMKFDSAESIDIDGDTSGLNYSWKIGNDKFSTSRSVTHKFDELWCFPIKLTVTSTKNGKSHTVLSQVKVINLPPDLGSLSMTMVDPNADPVVVNVTANGAKDPDGVIQSYLWYYYTDVDNEPQDFRSTTKPSTTFVLPKITGNYFFVLVMKDNNEARVTSEEIGDSKYSLTLSGDNVNTPLIDLLVNDNSIAVGEDVIFTANVKNILGKDIADASEFFWDFDGDGFYDKQTKENTTSYKFTKSGEFYSKVKVKHKGFSNVRNIPVNVANKLVADFDYISIGNKYIFINKSSGKVDTYTWDLGDGNRVEGKEYLQYSYEDKSNSHSVKFKVTEGTKVKETEKKVVSNPKNILKAKKEGLVVFTSPEYDENNQIVLENPEDSVHVYLWESKWEIKRYLIDFDTDYDSDVNGGKDDDIDNLWTPSLSNGSVAKIELNANKEQNVRFAILWENDVVIDAFDVKIIKNYITQQEISLDDITFNGVSSGEKVLLDKLKTLVSQMPTQYIKEASSFVQRLQEEYPDANEKTKVIMDFETFLDNEDIKNADDIIQVLEQVLTYGQDDKSEKWVAYAALSTLVPTGITCDGASCREQIIEKLDTIRQSSDVEANKQIGTEILTMIENSPEMTNKEKLDFKAVLKTFVYGWLANVPEDEVNEVVNETQQASDASGVKWILMYVLYAILGLIGILAVGGIGFWIFYKISGNGDSGDFKDFIAKKTGSETSDTQGSDVLWEVTPAKTQQPKVVETELQAVDPLTTTPVPADDENSVPDWLKWAQDNTESPQNSEKKLDDIPMQEKTDVQVMEPQTAPNTQEIPDWLKPAQSQENPQDTKKSDEATLLVDEVAKDQEETIPDWLKSEPSQPDIIPNPLDGETKDVEPIEPNEVLVDNIEDIATSWEKEVTKFDWQDLEVPDWLKGSFDQPASDSPSADQKTWENEVVNLDTPQDVQQVSSDNQESETMPVKKNSTPKKSPWKKEEAKKTKTPAKKMSSKTKKEETKTQDKKEDELWEDGMDIPDWLKDNDDNTTK